VLLCVHAQTTARPTSKWRPLPLTTVEMQKMVSRRLRISSEVCMQIGMAAG
jgi:DNA topoisomerase-3